MIAGDQFLEGLQLIFTFPSLLAIIIGVVIGIVIGAIPGLTTTMGMALFVPLTFFLDPLLGIPFLLGLYKGGIYGGSIPAILIATPGTGASVATVFDGYPLARQGKGKSALHMALFASTTADVISDLITLLFVAQLTRLVLYFGPPEMFAVLAFSLVAISLAAAETLWKGLMSASLGLLLGTVGLDIGGQERFTFGIFQLRDGFPFIPMLIGLFAVAIILEKVVRSTSNAPLEPVQIDKKDHLRWSQMRAVIPTILRSTGIGAALGVVPGVGQPIAAFLGYAQAKRFSKKPEEFGKGSYEGIAGAEAGNNAVNGPSLVPLLAFGIPGDVITAVLLGAFMVHGLRPGPQLFELHGATMYAILIGMVVANAILHVIGHYAATGFAQVTRVPDYVVLPTVLALAVVGSFAVNNNINDIFVMFAFGLLGFVLNRVKIPLAPLVITFLLMHDVETNLIRSLILFRGTPLGFLDHPIAAAFIGATIMILILAIVFGVRSQVRRRSGSRRAPLGPREE